MKDFDAVNILFSEKKKKHVRHALDDIYVCPNACEEGIILISVPHFTAIHPTVVVFFPRLKRSVGLTD